MNKPIINDENKADFGCVLNCAVRYCLGRQTYMPSLVMDFITPLLPELDDRTLYTMERDINWHGGDEGIARTDNKSAYGADFDYDRWYFFWRDIKAEIYIREHKSQAKPT